MRNFCTSLSLTFRVVKNFKSFYKFMDKRVCEQLWKMKRDEKKRLASSSSSLSNDID